jgi:hypothetical protein
MSPSPAASASPSSEPDGLNKHPLMSKPTTTQKTKIFMTTAPDRFCAVIDVELLGYYYPRFKNMLFSNLEG